MAKTVGNAIVLECAEVVNARIGRSDRLAARRMRAWCISASHLPRDRGAQSVAILRKELRAIYHGSRPLIGYGPSTPTTQKSFPALAICFEVRISSNLTFMGRCLTKSSWHRSMAVLRRARRPQAQEATILSTAEFLVAKD
ncbi:hypothetical protein E4U16_003964 [Claviceps sp. LM84 group G4]|nr:hypothetical protein E4U16_003964 [Claviceps sp. LM84 group G4]KAG6085065.1 hypothetical protein E4U33_002497 [Claviceps sp. LM78 group G4]